MKQTFYVSLLTALDLAAANCKKILLNGFLIGLNSIAYGQAGTLNLFNAPQSPNAASLGKFVEIPVGHYSGIPNISIPLYEWDIKGLKVPISLSYHASGVKVKEIPGPVGTNWALNAGGVITRIVRGHPDDHDPHVGQYDGDDYYDSINRRRVENAFSIGYGNEFNLNERYNMCLSAPGVTAANAVRSTGSYTYPVHYFNRMDTEIDLFYFNFLGNTGQFTFTNEGVPMLLSNTDLKIEYTNRKFKITDGNGIQYFFDSTEQALDESSNVIYYSGGGRLYTTSWYISKIVIPQSNQTVTFSYNRHWNYDLYPSNMYYDYAEAFYSRIDRIRYLSYVITNYTYGNGNGGCPPYDRDYPSTAPHYFANNLFINEINWNGNKIKFFGNTNRTDLYKYKFDSIKVTASSGELIRRIDLNYSYFNNSSPVAGQKKLKLDKVIINDQQYQFGYIESLYGKTLPIITAKGLDMWGYYNGEDDESGIPYYKVFDDPNMDPNIFFYIQDAASGPKNSDYKYGQIGTLNSITWPTDGKTNFEYEGNDYSYYPFVNPSYNIVTDPFTQMKFDSLIGKRFWTFTNPAYTTDYATKEREFVLHKDQTITLWLTLGQFPFETLQQYIDSVYNYWAEAHATLQKYNTTTGQFEDIITYDVFPIDSIGLPPDQFSYDQVKYKGLKNGVFTHALTEGRYKWVVELYGWYMTGDIEIGCVFPYKKGSNTYNAGGIRIKKIEFISRTDTDTSYVKNYDYKTDTASSGVLESPFANISTSAFCDYFHSGTWWCSECVLQESCGFLNLSSNPVIPLGNSKGGVIGYAKVTEKREDNSKTVYHFTNGQDDPYSFADQFAQSPILPTRTRITEDNSWKRGFQKQVDFFNNATQLVKQNFSKYEYDDSRLYNNSVSLALDNVVLYAGGQFSAFNGYYAIDFYTIRGNQNALKIEDSTVQYAPGNTIHEVTKYEYHNYSYPHSYPIKITNRNSRGEYTITNIKYPQDYTVGSNPTNATAISIKNLQDRHVTAPFIEKFVQKKNADGTNLRTVSGQYVRYKETLPYPDTVFNLQITAALTDFQTASIASGSAGKDPRYKPVINFLQYDNYGNIIEQARQNNVKEVFVWGYNHQYPVAKVVGSTYNAVMGMIDANIINNPGTEQQLQTELNKIRTGLASSQALVNTYAYKPLVGLISEIDAGGKKLYYDYDQFGRLALVRDQNKKILKKICYNYSGQPENCNWFGNIQMSQNFTRNNCTNDSIGGQVTYTVQANTYYATSQAAANELAQADINTNGQNYTNTNGSCTLMTWYSERVYGDFYSDLCDWPDEEPQPYYVDVPAGTFTSHISQEDATNQAWWYAQDQANTYGQCIDYVDLILNNYNTNSGYNYYVKLTDVNTYQQYEFQTFYGYGWLGTVPAGTYNIEIYTWNPWTGNFYFSVGCWYYGYGHTYNFYYVDIDEGCEEITIQ